MKEKTIRPRIATKDATRHILKRFNLHASKRFGQNFLIDYGIAREIAASIAAAPGDLVLEIGPGIGSLTQAILETGADVVAVEVDKKLPAVLAETLAGYDNFRLVEGDVLKLDLNEVMGGKKFKVAANLPYYITTPIIMGLLEQRLPVTAISCMVQKEVGLRLVAEPSTKDYGALTIASNFYTNPRLVLEVPPKAFLPAPAVDSVVVAFDVLEQPKVEVASEKLFFRIVKAAFGQRRKTILNALRSGGFADEEIKAAFTAAGLDLGRRGETFSLSEFASLTNALSEILTPAAKL